MCCAMLGTGVAYGAYGRCDVAYGRMGRLVRKRRRDLATANEIEKQRLLNEEEEARSEGGSRGVGEWSVVGCC
eukprot:3377088-Rhodomonas_salina.4